MVRKLSVPVLVCAVVLLVAGTALAVPPRFFDLVGNPFGPNPGASGSGFLNYIDALDETEVESRCAGLDPGTDYDVYVGTGFRDLQFIGSFTTNRRGRANFFTMVAGDASGDRVFIIVGGAPPSRRNAVLFEPLTDH